jgi:hypothetical protein
MSENTAIYEPLAPDFDGENVAIVSAGPRIKSIDFRHSRPSWLDSLRPELSARRPQQGGKHLDPNCSHLCRSPSLNSGFKFAVISNS